MAGKLQKSFKISLQTGQDGKDSRLINFIFLNDSIVKPFASLFIPFAFFLLISPNLLNAKVTLPSFFSDNMVLQQKTEAAIWGWAKPNGNVQVTSSWNKRNTQFNQTNRENGN